MKKLVVSALVVGMACVGTVAQAQVGAKKKAGDPRVEKLLEEANLQYKVDGDGDFVLGNSVGDGRSQIVWVLSDTSELGALEIREVWSMAYRSEEPISPETARRLLDQNSKVKLGAWQVKEMGGEHFAIFSAQIAADTDAQSLLTAMEAVTRTADLMELELTGKDDF